MSAHQCWSDEHAQPVVPCWCLIGGDHTHADWHISHGPSDEPASASAGEGGERS